MPYVQRDSELGIDSPYKCAFHEVAPDDPPTPSGKWVLVWRPQLPKRSAPYQPSRGGFLPWVGCATMIAGGSAAIWLPE